MSISSSSYRDQRRRRREIFIDEGRIKGAFDSSGLFRFRTF
jgi:hypothetical protein